MVGEALAKGEVEKAKKLEQDSWKGVESGVGVSSHGREVDAVGGLVESPKGLGKIRIELEKELQL